MDIILYRDGVPEAPATFNNFERKVRLCFTGGNHYDSVYPLSWLDSASLCQSMWFPEFLFPFAFLRLERYRRQPRAAFLGLAAVSVPVTSRVVMLE